MRIYIVGRIYISPSELHHTLWLASSSSTVTRWESHRHIMIHETHFADIFNFIGSKPYCEVASRKKRYVRIGSKTGHVTSKEELRNLCCLGRKNDGCWRTPHPASVITYPQQMKQSSTRTLDSKGTHLWLRLTLDNAAWEIQTRRPTTSPYEVFRQDLESFTHFRDYGRNDSSL